MPVPWKRVRERPPAPAPLGPAGRAPGAGPAAQSGVWSRSKQRRPAVLGGAARPPGPARGGAPRSLFELEQQQVVKGTGAGAFSQLNLKTKRREKNTKTQTNSKT